MKNFKGFTLIRTVRKNLVGVKGFTLIELLVVIAILGILASVALISFRSAQARSRDAERKSDLKQISSSLELYYSDYEIYPDSLPWGAELTDGKTIYMKVVPNDPSGGLEYFYRVDSTKQKYQLYARLENTEDINCISGDCNNPPIPVGVSCGGQICNFSITSTNTTPTE
jgi:prepilin-type N-terminal cleavage/methylation domain-containing protein